MRRPSRLKTADVGEIVLEHQTILSTEHDTDALRAMRRLDAADTRHDRRAVAHRLDVVPNRVDLHQPLRQASRRTDDREIDGGDPPAQRRDHLLAIERRAIQAIEHQRMASEEIRGSVTGLLIALTCGHARCSIRSNGRKASADRDACEGRKLRRLHTRTSQLTGGNRAEAGSKFLPDVPRKFVRRLVLADAQRVHVDVHLRQSGQPCRGV